MESDAVFILKDIDANLGCDAISRAPTIYGFTVTFHANKV